MVFINCRFITSAALYIFKPALPSQINKLSPDFDNPLGLVSGYTLSNCGSVILLSFKTSSSLLNPIQVLPELNVTNACVSSAITGSQVRTCSNSPNAVGASGLLTL